MHMLLTTQRKQATHASVIISMLMALDEDGDGTVSLNEFQVRHWPSTVSAIETC